MNAFSSFDAGATSQGPWINWGAQKEKFTIRDSAGTVDFKGFADNGVVMDIDNMQTGWCFISGLPGQAAQWVMNPSLSQFVAKPGEEYKKGFKIRCAVGGGATASWDQSGAGAWNAFVALVPALQQQPAGKLPLVRMTGTKSVKFQRGSTVEPVLEVVKWVDRPDCLKEGAAAGIAVETAQEQQQSVQAAASASAPSDAEF
ncbi:hypothetical protein RM190_04855 [Paracoccus sp. CPCC 101403]|uniref:Uncharacterized protein n=1 Tax=Paracoccus broussonetiae TaxID=3075834 RepID=A0ABU3EAC5_9RHOB|nr:hypothetical protein [Paracoccus sp. CPCC 101403]MDT1061178.1 hypothetical protein [Paracoccus sp. CPCC 101403]